MRILVERNITSREALTVFYINQVEDEILLDREYMVVGDSWEIAGRIGSIDLVFICFMDNCDFKSQPVIRVKQQNSKLFKFNTWLQGKKFLAQMK